MNFETAAYFLVLIVATAASLFLVIRWFVFRSNPEYKSHPSITSRQAFAALAGVVSFGLVYLLIGVAGWAGAISFAVVLTVVILWAIKATSQSRGKSDI